MRDSARASVRTAQRRPAAEPEPRGLRSETEIPPLAAWVNDSPRMVAQRRQLTAAFGARAQLAVLPKRSGVVQAAWGQVGYQVSSAPRTMEVDDLGPRWGGTAGPGGHAAHASPVRPRAILFETMCRDTDIVAIRDRLNAVPSLWDTGLTIVINRAYTPAKVHTPQGVATAHDKSDVNQSLGQAKAGVDGSFNAATGAWAGMPINVVKAVWERREIGAGDGPGVLEAAQGSVPYSTFRKLAAEAPGAGAIETELRSNHEEGKVWRKMGDDDMPYVNPNPGGVLAANTEVGKLSEVEDQAQMYVRPTLVTFGYNLVTQGTNPPITGILQGIYAKEMALRDAIAALGAPMYPSEPTTFYQPRVGGSASGAWNIMERQLVGGSGQQLEGAKLAKALVESGMGYEHYAFHTVQVNTGAGARNNPLINVLNGLYGGGMGNIWAVSADAIEAEINALDQSALRHDEYLAKVIGNLDGNLSQQTHKAIERLVALYRKEAAEEARDALVAAMRNIQTPLAYARIMGETSASRHARYGT